MGKRRIDSEDDHSEVEHGDEATDEEGITPEKPVTKKQKGSDKSGDEKKIAGESKGKGAFVNKEGEKYIVIGKKRHVTVRTFKSQTLIDIREFYGSDGDEKPGKKGIALSLDQWNELKENMPAIDELINDISAKKK